MIKQRYRFKVLEIYQGIETYEEWSGLFNTEKEAEDWYGKEGMFFTNRGYKLKLFRVDPYENRQYAKLSNSPWFCSERKCVKNFICINGKCDYDNRINLKSREN